MNDTQKGITVTKTNVRLQVKAITPGLALIALREWVNGLEFSGATIEIGMTYNPSGATLNASVIFGQCD